MFYGGGYGNLVRRITKSADSIRIPKARRGGTTRSAPDPRFPALVRGRRPRTPPSSSLAWISILLVAAGLTLLAFQLLR